MQTALTPKGVLQLLSDWEERASFHSADPSVLARLYGWLASHVSGDEALRQQLLSRNCVWAPLRRGDGDESAPLPPPDGGQLGQFYRPSACVWRDGSGLLEGESRMDIASDKVQLRVLDGVYPASAEASLIALGVLPEPTLGVYMEVHSRECTARSSLPLIRCQACPSQTRQR